MASTHTSGTLYASATLTAATTANSSAFDNTVKYGGIITAKITTGGTADDPPAYAEMQFSPDNSTWYFWTSQAAGVSGSTAYPLAFIVPPEVAYARLVFHGSATNNVTVEAQYQALATI